MDQRGRGCNRGRRGRGHRQNYRRQSRGCGEHQNYERVNQDDQQEHLETRYGHYENQTFARGELSHRGGRVINRGNVHSNRGRGKTQSRFCQQPVEVRSFGPRPKNALKVPPSGRDFHSDKLISMGILPNAEEWEEWEENEELEEREEWEEREITHKFKHHPNDALQQPTMQQNMAIPVYQNLVRSQSVQHIGPHNFQRPQNTKQTAPRDSRYHMSRSSSVQKMVDNNEAARVNSPERGRRTKVARDILSNSREGINRVNDEDEQKRDKEGNQANGAYGNNINNRQLRNRGRGRRNRTFNGTDGIDTIPIQTLKNRIKRYKKKINVLKSEKGIDAPEVLKLQKEISEIKHAIEQREQNENESKNNDDSDDSSLKCTSHIQHKRRTKIPENAIYQRKEERKRIGSLLSEGSVDCGQDEVELFKFLVREMKGAGSPEEIIAKFWDFNYYQGGVDGWFKRHSREFTVFQKRNVVFKVSVFVKDAEYCVDYTTRNRCTKSGCHRYHFCKLLLCGRCTYGRRCKFSHDSFDEHNAPISNQLGFSNVFTNDEIIQIVSLRFPHVCKSWNEKGTCSDEMCCKLHICQRHVFGDCLEGDGCAFEHSLETVQNQMIRRAFRMANWKQKLFFKMIFTPRRPMDHVRNTGELTPLGGFPGHTTGGQVCEASVVGERSPAPQQAPRAAPQQTPHLDLCAAPRKLQTDPDTESRHPGCTDDTFITSDTSGSKYICEKHVAGRCDNSDCTNYHGDSCGLPYIWQIKLCGKWVSLPSQQAADVERDFCSWKSISGTYTLVTSLTYDEGTIYCVIVFCPEIHAYTRQFGFEMTRTQARRLSTPSYAEGELTNDTYKTQWRWSWADDRGAFQLFETDKFQYTLEKKYLGGQKKYLYSRENYTFQYCLELGNMNQVNLDTCKERKVFRRPLLVTKEDVLQRKYPLDIQPPPAVSVSLPQGWIDWDLAHPFELVELEPSNTTYTEVEDHFYKTLDRSTQIIDHVYRVQNPILWSAFITHKGNMSANAVRAGRGPDVRELLLFHGTDSLDTVRGIAINNFDHRLSGKNATMHGEGAYFAKNAKYSHAYTKPPDRFMFLARVLVGEYTDGDRSLKRPPAKPGAAHELYDSCVDNIASPSIYIVFDTKQYYPELLVQYHSLDRVSDDFGSLRYVPGTVQGRTQAVTQASSSTPTPGPTYASSHLNYPTSATGYQGSITTQRAPSAPQQANSVTNKPQNPSPVRTMYPSASVSYQTSQSKPIPHSPSPPPVNRSAAFNREPRKNKDCVLL